MNYSSARYYFLAAACAVALSTGAAGSDSFGQAPQGTAAKVFQAWRARERQVQSARFAWTERKTTMKGTLPGKGFLAGADPKKPSGEEPVFPPEDVTHEIRRTVALSGVRLRATKVGPAWCVDVNRFLPQEYLAVADGKARQVLYDHRERSNDVHPVAFVDGDKNVHQDARSVGLRPLILHVRPLTPQVGGVELRNWRLLDEVGIVDGRRCLVFQDVSHPRDPYAYLAWVDVERDSTVVRYELRVRGAATWRASIAHTKNDAHGWVPEKWEIVHYADGKLRESSSCAVTGYEINGPVDDREFKIDFPVGTEVNERNPNHETVMSLLKKGGVKRIVRPEENVRGATYEELMATESGMAGLPRKRGILAYWWIWLVVFAGVVVLIARTNALLRGRA